MWFDYLIYFFILYIDTHVVYSFLKNITKNNIMGVLGIVLMVFTFLYARDVFLTLFILITFILTLFFVVTWIIFLFNIKRVDISKIDKAFLLKLLMQICILALFIFVSFEIYFNSVKYNSLPMIF